LHLIILIKVVLDYILLSYLINR